MGTDTRYLIVGGGLTAARAVEGIREVDETGRITVLTDEPHLPYERPPLSKGVLLGADDHEVAFPHDRAWYVKQGVEVRTQTAVAAFDASEHTATTADGETIGWDRLLLATGSSPRTLSVPGADLPGVHYLRTMDESVGLLVRLKTGGDVVIIGAGWIGLEVAAAARSHGCRVTVIDPQPVPLRAALGKRIGAWFAELHRAHGVDFRFGTGVASIIGQDAVTGVLTTDGETIPAATVVVGIGIRPNTELAEAAGAAVDNGVVTDGSLRTTLPDVWAAGDVASWASALLGTQLRVEHWANANYGGLAAGRSMAGAAVNYDPIPYFYTDQYDVGMEYTGHVPAHAEVDVLVRGELDSGRFLAFWVMFEGERVRVVAGMQVNTWDTIDAVQELIRSGVRLDPARLADPSVPLDDLA